MSIGIKGCAGCSRKGVMTTGKELIQDIDRCLLNTGEMAFWWLGQLGYAIKIGNTTVYIDAYLSEAAGRNISSLLKPEEIINADFILGSHDHEDHIDRPVWKKLAKSSPNAKFVVPGILITTLSDELEIPIERFIGLDDGMSVSLGEITITGIAAAHEFLDQDVETGAYPYLGFIVKGNGCSFYHSGDTCIYPELVTKLEKLAPYQVMFLPINGRDAVRFQGGCIGNMTYQEAVDLTGSLKPQLAVPGHYEMFSSNSENPWLFSAYLEAKYPHIPYWIGSHGEKVLIGKK